MKSPKDKKDSSFSKTPDEYTENIIRQNIVTEMKTSFIEYSMSVITSRALPDIRDGLKPVHRRILYAMRGMGLYPSAKFRKSATVVGEVLGKYHPHGDSSVYEAMVGMAQEFSYRYPLILGQGNFGSIDGDSAAAHRYTEAKMSRVSEEILRDIEKETVDFQPNYDGTQKEPIVLPATVPNLLLNGVLGIAVGMATNIPPHNLGEVIDATLHLMENPQSTTDDLLMHVKGPDFPLGGIAYDKKAIATAYATGRGGVVCRGNAEIIEAKNGKFEIIITSIPYRVNRANLIIRIAELVQDKKLVGIRDIRDESAADTRIVIELKTGVTPERVLNYIYKHTELESNFNYNMTALIDGVPKTVSLKDILEQFVIHRGVVIRRRTEFELKKARARAHILEGLKLALDNIDEVIKIIKASKDVNEARANLIARFKFSEIQAQAILEMRLQKLANLERKAIEDELHELIKVIKDLEDILAKASRVMTIMKTELTDIRAKFGDARRTQIVAKAVGAITDEDLVPEKDMALVMTSNGYIKRTDPSEYKTQNRGGVGVHDINTKDEDIVTTLLVGNTKSDCLFFTDKGRVYSIKLHELPEGGKSTKGKSINNFISLATDENITSVLVLPKDIKQNVHDTFIAMATRMGSIKKVALDSFTAVRRSGIIVMNLKEKDTLLGAYIVKSGDAISLQSQDGISIAFQVDDVRPMGRTAGGVRGMNLKKDDALISGGVLPKAHFSDAKILVISREGYGKMTSFDEYKTQNRGGSGVKTMQVTEKTGTLQGGAVVLPHHTEMIVISKNGITIRISLSDIPTLQRATQGVRIMRLKEEDEISTVALL